MAANLNRQPQTPFVAVDLTKAKSVPPGCTRAYSNNRYMVTVYDHSPTTKGPAIRAMVQRWDDTIIPHHWAEMQRIKNEIFGAETVAVEYYPAQSQLRDDHNIYWFWIFEKAVLPIPIPD